MEACGLDTDQEAERLTNSQPRAAVKLLQLISRRDEDTSSGRRSDNVG
jgi:hypothetical protein